MSIPNVLPPYGYPHTNFHEVLIIVGQRADQFLDYRISVPSPRLHRSPAAQIEMQFGHGFPISVEGMNRFNNHMITQSKENFDAIEEHLPVGIFSTFGGKVQ
jgi:hypothetical protein